MEKNLNFLIKEIKAKTGLDREAIAKRINYSRGHLSLLVKDNNQEAYKLLEKEFSDEIYRAIPPDMTNSADILVLSASVKMLYSEVSALKARSENITKKEAYIKMKAQTNSILTELI